MIPLVDKNSVTIRAMRLEDVHRVYEIDQLSFSLPWTERSYRFELNENPNSQLWVAEITRPDGVREIAGMVVVWLIIDEAHIGSIAVHPNYRRLGIGRLLLDHALIEARKKGATQSLLEVRRGNQPAQALYQVYGFKVVGMRPRYYRDNGEDALLMTLASLEHLPGDQNSTP